MTRKNIKRGSGELKRILAVVLFVLVFFVAVYADTKTSPDVESGELNIGPFSSLAVLAGLIGIIYDSRKQGKMLGEVTGVQKEIKDLININNQNIKDNINRLDIAVQQHDKRLDVLEQFQAVCSALKKAEVK